MKKQLIIAIIIGLAVLGYAIFVSLKTEPTPEPAESSFKGPIGAPYVIGPSGPPPNKVSR